MAKYKHIIFDLDGTLLDTIPDLLFNLNRTFKELGLPGGFNSEEMASFIGSGKDEQIRRALKARWLKESHFADVNALLTKYYAQNTDSYTKVFPGVNETLEALKKAGVKLYVATNKPENVAKDVVKRFFGEDTFLIVRGDKGDGIIKPNPKFLGSVTKAIEDPLDTILFVGDSHVDFLSAKNAGMNAAIVPHGYDKNVLLLSDKGLHFLKNFKDILLLEGK
ncbi:MAG: HAD-IA family hydrolase [Bacilli bacterium]|nr:HAD-IA family hydrolase [Bacilli bacterium]